MRRIAALLAVATAAVAAAGPVDAQTLRFEAACAAGPRVRIAAVGDLLFHDALQRRALTPAGSYRQFWQPVQSILDTADMVYGNFEGPAADGVVPGGGAGKDPGRIFDRWVYGTVPGTLVFNYHPSAITDLKASRFTVLSTANNHSADRGSLGIDRTIDNLRRAGIAYTGTRRRDEPNAPWSTTTTANGVTVAWLACTYSTNGMPDRHGQVLNCYSQRDAVMAELQRLAADPAVHAVILTPHWGQEYMHQPMASDRRYAREAIDAGADAVLGAHPHVLQPWEKHVAPDGREGLIIYSLGNFISNQQKPAQRSGVIALLELTRPDGAARARLSATGFVPTWVDFTGAGHRVTEMRGEGTAGTPLAATLQLLPKGHRVAGSAPWNLPRTCGPDLVASSRPDAPVAAPAQPAARERIAERGDWRGGRQRQSTRLEVTALAGAEVADSPADLRPLPQLVLLSPSLLPPSLPVTPLPQLALFPRPLPPQPAPSPASMLEAELKTVAFNRETAVMQPSRPPDDAPMAAPPDAADTPAPWRPVADVAEALSAVEKTAPAPYRRVAPEQREPVPPVPTDPGPRRSALRQGGRLDLAWKGEAAAPPV